MRRSVMVFVLGLAGCAGVGGSDCGPDWFAVGQRDGRMGAGSQAERYAARCGTPVDVQRYEEGYRDGFSQRPRPVV